MKEYSRNQPFFVFSSQCFDIEKLAIDELFILTTHKGKEIGLLHAGFSNGQVRFHKETLKRATEWVLANTMTDRYLVSCFNSYYPRSLREAFNAVGKEAVPFEFDHPVKLTRELLQSGDYRYLFEPNYDSPLKPSQPFGWDEYEEGEWWYPY